MQEEKVSNSGHIPNEVDNNNYSRCCSPSRRLRVTFLASEWGSSKGWLSTLNRELAINIAKDPRVEVSYFVPSCNDEDKKAAHSHKIELIKAVRRPGFDELQWLSFPPEDFPIDIVVGNSVKLGHQAQIIKETHKCKWIQVVHTDPEELGIYKEYTNPISNAHKKHETEVELCELADFVIPVGPRLCKAFHSYLASCKKEQCFFEFTPGILTEFSELNQVLDKREVCKVLCFGRGDAEDFKLKGFDIAARAVAKLSNCHLLFVGAAKEKLEETQKRFLDCGIPSSQLRVRPFLNSRDDLKKLFCEADLVVVPSRTDGFGLTGLEALSAGLPILVSKKSGFGEALMKISFGWHFVIDSDDQDQWANAIEKVCSNDRRNRLEESEILRKLYEKTYCWKKQSESLIGEMINIAFNDPSRGCGSAAENFTLPHHEEVSNEFCSGGNVLTRFSPDFLEVSACPTLGTVPIRITLNSVTFQKAKGKDPAKQEEAKRFIMAEMTRNFLDRYQAEIPSEKCPESLDYYLKGVLDLLIRQAGEGSLRIVVECRTLEILERLWEDYSSGHLNEVAEERLLTDEIKKKHEVESIELETTIIIEDYLACKVVLADLNRDSTVAEDQIERANLQPRDPQVQERHELITVHFPFNYSGCSLSPNESHPEQEKGGLHVVSEMLSEEETSQSYLQHVSVSQEPGPTTGRDDSLRFSVECRNLESLERLWSDYRSGRLNWMAEKYLLTDDIKRRFHVESATLETRILEEDYLACKEHLSTNFQTSSNSTMGDCDDTEILVTDEAVQTGNIDDIGIQTYVEAICKLNGQSKAAKETIHVEDIDETIEETGKKFSEKKIIAGKIKENSNNSTMGDCDDIKILVTDEAVQTGLNINELGIETFEEAIYHFDDLSKVLTEEIQDEDKNETIKDTNHDFVAQSGKEFDERITSTKVDLGKYHLTRERRRKSITYPRKIPAKMQRSATWSIRASPQPKATTCSDTIERKWSSLDMHQKGPEPFQSITGQELLKDNYSKCGWIRKEGGSVKSWRDRYVILHKGSLYYYNTVDAKTTNGKFSLSGYRLSPAPEKTSKFPWTFKLVHLQPEKRTYYFAAYSEQEMTEWMDSIISDMKRYCWTGRQSIIEPNNSSELEYCYPEVEPKFDMQQLAAMFEKPQPQPTSEPMYSPPPEMDSSQVQRKPLPPQRPAFPSPKPVRGGFSYTGSSAPTPGQGAASIGAVRQSPRVASPSFPRKITEPPAVPSRKGKPLAPREPLPQLPPLMRHTTEPIMRFSSSPCGDQEDGESYLDIVPDTNPEDVGDTHFTLSRGYPDGRSIRRHHNEGVLPSSAVKLHVDKIQVAALLENKLGVYILRKSQNAQSERALSVWTGDRVRHYMVFQDEKGYALDPDGVRCKTIEDLLRHFYNFALPRCDVKLKAPYK